MQRFHQGFTYEHLYSEWTVFHFTDHLLLIVIQSKSILWETQMDGFFMKRHFSNTYMKSFGVSWFQ